MNEDDDRNLHNIDNDVISDDAEDDASSDSQDDLQKLNLINNYHHGGDFCDPGNYGERSLVQKCINKLKNILMLLNNSNTDWSKFKLDKPLWGDIFSTTADGIHEFSGSYYAANSSSRSKIFGEADENDSFAFLTSSMDHRTNISHA